MTTFLKNLKATHTTTKMFAAVMLARTRLLRAFAIRKK